MYKIRNNFSFTKDASFEEELKKTKKEFLSVFESLSVEELNNLYSPEENKDNKEVGNTTTAPTPQAANKPASAPPQEAPDANLQYSDLHDTTASDGVELKKDNETGNIVVGAKKPVKVVFATIPTTTTQIAPTEPTIEKPNDIVPPGEENPQEQLVKEGTEVLDDEVIVPIELSPGYIDKHKVDKDTDYDCVGCLPGIDLENDLEANRPPMPHVLKDGPLDTVVVKKPTLIVKHLDNVMAPEDDVIGTSVAGMDMDLAARFL
jgi:hypothetical protein